MKVQILSLANNLMENKVLLRNEKTYNRFILLYLDMYLFLHVEN